MDPIEALIAHGPTLAGEPLAWAGLGALLIGTELVVATMIGATLGVAALATAGLIAWAMPPDATWLWPVTAFCVAAGPAAGAMWGLARALRRPGVEDPNVAATPRNPAYDAPVPTRRPIQREPRGTPDRARDES